MSEMQQRTGLRSLELMYEPIADVTIDDTVAYRAILQINNPDIGVILPEEYMPVAIRTVQCEKLASWALEEVFTAIEALTSKDVFFDWISVHIPTRWLKNEKFFEELDALLHERKIETRKLRFDFSVDLLYEIPADLNPLLDKIEAKGIHTMISDFGGDFCPVLRLGDFRVFAVNFSKEICFNLQFDERIESVFSVIELAKSLNKEVILSGIDLKDTAELAEDRECKLVSGLIAGKSKKLSSIK